MEPYIGEIRIFAGNFAPYGWLFCDGKLQNISENPALYQLIGTTYGGDGITKFALPNMCSRVAVGQGRASGLSNYVVGQAVGTESVTLTTSQLPTHQHPITAGTVSAITGASVGVADPVNNYFGDKGVAAYNNASSPDTLATGAVTGQSTPAGGSQPHANVQPVTAISYIICTEGTFPPRDY